MLWYVVLCYVVVSLVLEIVAYDTQLKYIAVGQLSTVHLALPELCNQYLALRSGRWGGKLGPGDQ